MTMSLVQDKCVEHSGGAGNCFGRGSIALWGRVSFNNDWEPGFLRSKEFL